MRNYSSGRADQQINNLAYAYFACFRFGLAVIYCG